MTDCGLKLVVVEDPNILFPVNEIANRIVEKNRKIIATQNDYQKNFNDRLSKVGGSDFSCMKIKDVDNTFYLQRGAMNKAHGILNFNDANKEFIEYITVLNGLSSENRSGELIVEYEF